MAEEQKQQPQLLTLPEAAARIGVTLHRLRYAVTDAKIAPKQRAGIIRLFGVDQLPEMARAVGRVAGRRP